MSSMGVALYIELTIFQQIIEEIQDKHCRKGKRKQFLNGLPEITKIGSSDGTVSKRALLVGGQLIAKHQRSFFR